MLKITSIAQVISIAMLSLTLANQAGQAAKTLRPAFLLKTQCANAGTGNWAQQMLNVSIGRQVYQSLFYMGPGDKFASLSCRIRPEASAPLFQTLHLGFGMRDIERSSPANTVTIYLDGKPTITRTINPGQPEVLSLDVINVSNVGIETTCSNQFKACDRVYFFDASLERIPPSPTQRK
jgi:hypothetical protein